MPRSNAPEAASPGSTSTSSAPPASTSTSSPRGVNKGTTLRRVLSWLGRPETDVVVAGDTLNDLALFETGMAGIVVGNGEPALRERVRDREHTYHARAHGAAGILEGLTHFGWIPEASHGQ